MSSVNIQIYSTVGFRNSFDQIVGPATYLQTLQDLEGSLSLPYPVPTRTLTASSLTNYLIYLSQTPPGQTITLTNLGNSTLTITNIVFTSNSVTPQATFGAGWVGSATSITSGTSKSFQLSYQAEYEGEFVNSFTIKSNNDTGDYKVTTYQYVNTVFDYSISPSSFSESITEYGKQSYQDFVLTPYYGSIDSLTFSVGGGNGFTATRIGNKIRVIFDANEIENVNGSYSDTLTISLNGLTKTVSLSAVVNIDTNTNKHLGSWQSTPAYYDSYVAMSYDIIAGVRTLTIGVGTKSASTPTYTEGGALFVTTSSLSLAGGNIIDKYPYWNTVYQVPLTGAAKTYSVNSTYRQRLRGTDYSSYFGEYHNQGTMFFVEDDGYGNLEITLNHLRETSDDDSLTVTLENLTRSFYEYSAADLVGRFGTQPSPVGDGTMTRLFTGFNLNGGQITVLTPYPV